ncbi:leucine-rich repeat-containing serine/threonine-protein kinase [Mucilaginibacter sp. SMC90]|uniref:leucine-rich repeat-containing protein kinase family protein n=1 Tax=Mucilaginibacter sp. SMC90 TaxID=2929803 RepID=UPI001FB22AC6|nr:leucine-rich repeat-containing protein kinase family protein [Mucilaginibacter sp. SMC90]UOE49053.1 leucine-rich repeat-containing serine/threonine-protein kinase [Mucilaginibacter sp. SMC90]
MQTLKQLQNGELKGTISLKLSEQLSHFPVEIFALADTLEYLDLSFNDLSTLPADFGRLRKLRIFFCSENRFTVLPEVLADCPHLDIVGFKSNQIETVPPRSVNPNLRWLILTNNSITGLPAEIGNCSRMQKLMLAGNRLKELPASLANCRNLELLRISANQLSEFPEWLLSLPKLAWLAFSGNPFSYKPIVQSLEPIDSRELQISELLGEGASGIISKATWRHAGETSEVAVKIFKGAVTSDGLPEDEMDACISAGNHDGLAELIGQITNHPENKKGLVMKLIPDTFYNLGLPPSFISCTRDVFKPGMGLTPAQILKITGTIASVAEHLHSKGIMHSDLYAHNILIDDEANTLFSDFGAACFYDASDIETARKLELLEVRAYGCLLDDLISLCNEAEHPGIEKLTALRDMCMSDDVSKRPLFYQILSQLHKL